MGLAVSNFLTKVRLKSKIPQNQVNDEEILSIADDEIRNVLIPEIVSMNENYFLQEFEEQYNTNKTEFRNPSGSIGGGLLELQAKRSGNKIYNVDKINVEDKSRFWPDSSYWSFKSGVNFGFYSTAGGFKLYPNPNSTGTLVMTYLLRPGRLVKESETGTVAAIFEDTSQLELNQIPTQIEAGTEIDIMKSDRLNERVIVDAEVQQVDTGTQRITVPDIDYDKVSVGDTVSVNGTSPYWPVEEYSGKLIDMTCRRIAQIIGDQKLLNDVTDSMERYDRIIKENISPRVKEEVDNMSIDW